MNDFFLMHTYTGVQEPTKCADYCLVWPAWVFLLVIYIVFTRPTWWLWVCTCPSTTAGCPPSDLCRAQSTQRRGRVNRSDAELCVPGTPYAQLWRWVARPRYALCTIMTQSCPSQVRPLHDYDAELCVPGTPYAIMTQSVRNTISYFAF